MDHQNARIGDRRWTKVPLEMNFSFEILFFEKNLFFGPVAGAATAQNVDMAFVGFGDVLQCGSFWAEHFSDKIELKIGQILVIFGGK
jgi:hypothetical protein